LKEVHGICGFFYELRRRGGGIGVASICGGLAQGDGAVVQVERE